MNLNSLIKKFLTFIFILFSLVTKAQVKTGTIYSSETNSAIAYVNVGIIGKNVGTVSDESGNFELKVDSIYYKDSIRFTCIGYESKTFLAEDFIQKDIVKIFLNSIQYKIPEASITEYRKAKNIVLGITSTPIKKGQGFAYSSLGSEMGINVYLKKKVLLKDINFKIYKCPFDTVEYRVNIYVVNESLETKNILKEPVYLKFSKNDITEILTFDLRQYNLSITGNILITLELFRDLGEGKIIFLSNWDISNTWGRKTSEGVWKLSPGVPIFYLNGLIVK